MRSSARELLMIGGVVLLLLAVLGAMIGGGVWLTFRGLEDRFGANVAVLVFGGAVVLLAFVGGALFDARQQKQARTDFLQGLGELGEIVRGTSGVQREQLRADREAFRARAQIDVIDARRVDALARQRARLLVDAQRESEQPQPGGTWQAQAQVPAARETEGRRAAAFRYIE